MRLGFFVALGAVVCAAANSYVMERSGATRTGELKLPALDSSTSYGLLYSLDTVAPDTRVTVELKQGPSTLLRKTLHDGDADFYADFRPVANGAATLSVVAAGTAGHFKFQVVQWPAGSPVKAAPTHDAAHAMNVALGRTIYASGDESPYIPVAGTGRAAAQENPIGEDWYKVAFAGAPTLVYFQVDLMERDNLPVDVSIHRMKDGKLEGYYEGEDPVSFPHEVQALQGNKFVARILKEPGDYYIRVRANHPEYKFRTRVYDPPPYNDPEQAVRTALDFALGAGDSWHANTPRRGGVLDRIEPVHQETSLCVACHATHFTQRAALYAARNGYAINQRQELQFLSERFYNNPRPFYGFEAEGATWARMISASANVLSRMSYLMGMLEQDVTGERRDDFHNGIASYLKIYYRDRDKLPPDETNGNTPLVSAHEVAWYSWGVTHDPKLPDLIAKGEVKNMVDLCYQTLALAEIDPAKYHDQIKANADRILSLQRASGQWSMRFAPKEPEVEFQTGHALWALHAAGVPRGNPQVAKGLAYLLMRQQPFGGWMDPLQSFENFRTPFRETQMSVLALSAYYPAEDHKKGWDSALPSSLSAEAGKQLEELDRIWTRPTAELSKQVAAAAASTFPLVRQAAVEALGRVGDPASMPLLIRALGDDSKLVQRTAAWAVRQIYSRHTDTPAPPLIAALGSSDERVSWGATRVFAQHFAALARRPEFAVPLLADLNSKSTAVQMQAVRGLWQYWFWSNDAAVKGRIEDAILAATAKPQQPWVEVNLQRAIYNLADENIRYLYNNWVPLLSQQADRERAIQGRLSVESRLADKFAKVLDSGNDHQRKMLLAALTEFPLRRADVYDLKADLAKPGPTIYNRIGNDIEQIAFFGDAGERFAASLTPLLDSPDADMKRLAENAALLVREVKFADVNRLAGTRGPKTLAVVAKTYHPPPPQPATVAGAAPRKRANMSKLDENFFRGYVQPILEKRGKDGYACVQCHATHTLFDATWSTVKNVVDPDNPEESLILRKPTSSSESEGVVGAATLAHGGGIRFDKNSAEYTTILEWIKGAKE